MINCPAPWLRASVQLLLAMVATTAGMPSAVATEGVKMGWHHAVRSGAGLNLDIRDGVALARRHLGSRLGNVQAGLIVADAQFADAALRAWQCGT
jgi:hypothetical protein